MFINHVRNECTFTNAAIEALPEDSEAQRPQLTKLVTDVLIQREVAIWRIPKAEVLAAFGHPPLRFRNQVRDVVSAMWPEINGGFGSLLVRDALALGLYCQVEHLLSLED